MQSQEAVADLDVVVVLPIGDGARRNEQHDGGENREHTCRVPTIVCTGACNVPCMPYQPATTIDDERATHARERE